MKISLFDNTRTIRLDNLVCGEPFFLGDVLYIRCDRISGANNIPCVNLSSGRIAFFKEELQVTPALVKIVGDFKAPSET